jgi:hypothetical protein
MEHVGHLPLQPNPVLLLHARERAESVQNRIADKITAFAGSMAFVYIHVIWLLLNRSRPEVPSSRSTSSGVESRRPCRIGAEVFVVGVRVAREGRSRNERR